MVHDRFSYEVVNWDLDLLDLILAVKDMAKQSSKLINVVIVGLLTVIFDALNQIKVLVLYLLQLILISKEVFSKITKRNNSNILMGSRNTIAASLSSEEGSKFDSTSNNNFVVEVVITDLVRSKEIFGKVPFEGFRPNRSVHCESFLVDLLISSRFLQVLKKPLKSLISSD